MERKSLTYELDNYVVAALTNIEKHSLNISKESIDDIKNYIIVNYVDSGRIRFSIGTKFSPAKNVEKSSPNAVKETSTVVKEKPFQSKLGGLREAALKFFLEKDIEKTVDKIEKGFVETLFSHLDNSGLTDAEVYKRANIDRRLFSKIRSNKNYQPSRNTALRLAIALNLDISKTDELISLAGYAFSNSSKRDLIIRYFIENKLYDLTMLNEMLFAFNEDIL